MTILASGQVAATKTPIFEVLEHDVIDHTRVVVSKIRFFNTSAMLQIVKLYFTEFSGISRVVESFDLHQNKGEDFLGAGASIELKRGDAIEAETTTADAVNFFVTGRRF